MAESHTSGTVGGLPDRNLKKPRGTRDRMIKYKWKQAVEAACFFVDKGKGGDGMKIKKTFRLSEDIVELMDHRDQRKYPSREFYLESAVRKFAENPDDKTDEKLESILSAVHKNEQLGMEILSQLQKGKKTEYVQKINEEFDLDTFDHLL